jgi:drug/metabolite transporter (DMT)-like permease
LRSEASCAGGDDAGGFTNSSECRTLHTLILFLGTVVIWGSTWIAIAMQVGPVPVLVSVFYRFAVAALVLIIALVVTRRLERPALHHQPFLIAQAFCLFSFNFICFYTAAAYVTSGLISVIFSLATICNAVNARLFFGDRVTGRVVVAALMGAGGVVSCSASTSGSISIRKP